MAEQIIWRLWIGTKLSGITVEPDGKWPGMWRIHSPNGRVSDMVNLSRARNAALEHARATGIRRAGNEPVSWEKHSGDAAGTPPEGPGSPGPIQGT